MCGFVWTAWLLPACPVVLRPVPCSQSPPATLPGAHCFAVNARPLTARVSALQALEVAQGLDALGDRDWDLSMALCFVWVNVSLAGLGALGETVVWCGMLACSHGRLWPCRIRGFVGGNMPSPSSWQFRL